MKFSSQEEYGLRILLQVARHPEGVTIPQISALEDLSEANVAKMTRLLRMGGYLESTRGQEGGYTLARRPSEIVVHHVLQELGGKLFDEDFCEKYSGDAHNCTTTVPCSVRSVWQRVQQAIDTALEGLTLQDLIAQESKPIRSIGIKPR